MGLVLGARGPDRIGPGAGLCVLGWPLKSRQKMLTLEPLVILMPGALFPKEREREREREKERESTEGSGPEAKLASLRNY